MEEYLINVESGASIVEVYIFVVTVSPSLPIYLA